MRLYITAKELLLVDALLARYVLDENAPPQAYDLMGKVKRMIDGMTELIPDDRLAA